MSEVKEDTKYLRVKGLDHLLEAVFARNLPRMTTVAVSYREKSEPTFASYETY